MSEGRIGFARARRAGAIAATLGLVSCAVSPVLAAGRQYAQTPAQRITAHMMRALSGESHVQAYGSIRGPGKLVTGLRFGFVAPSSETVTRTGGVLRQVKVGKQVLNQAREVSVGSRSYFSIDGTHWLRSVRRSPATAFDVLTLNGLNATCCSGPAIRVRDLGIRTTPRGQAYVLVFRAPSTAGLVTATVLVSTTTYLPLSYTTTAQSPYTTSTIRLAYGGTFSIRPPV